MKFPDYVASISPETIYKNSILDQLIAPKGYEFTGEFRPSAPGEFSLSADGHTVLTGMFDIPRLILRVPKRKVVTFTHTGQVVTTVLDGQWYHWSPSDMYYLCVSKSLYYAAGVELVIRTATEI